MNLKRFVQKIVKCYCFDERIKFEDFDFDNILKDIRFVLGSIKQINLLEFMMEIYVCHSLALKNILFTVFDKNQNNCYSNTFSEKCSHQLAKKK